MSCVEFAFLSRSCLNVAILLAVCTEDCKLSCTGFSASSVYHVLTVHENKHWISLNSNTGVCVRQGEQTSHYSPFILPFSYLPFSPSYLFFPFLRSVLTLLPRLTPNSWVQAIFSFLRAGLEVPSTMPA